MLRIRRARPEDEDRMRAVHAAAIRAGCRTHYQEAEIETWIARRGPLDDPRHDVLVADDAGRVRGFGAFDAGQAEIRAVYVDPDAGRHGIGRRLLAALETVARLRGVTALRLDASLNAVDFYAAAGWRRERDTVRTFPGGRDIACVAMTKALPAARLVIREETPADVDAVREVERLAFERDGEAILVDRLRGDAALRISCVAALDGAVVGHVAFSPVAVGDAPIDALGLGPVAVRPELQQCAIGARLIEEGLARARERGTQAVVVLGHPEYYPRFGFVVASRFGLRFSAPVPDEAFMVAELVAGTLPPAGGVVRYHPAFDAV